MAFSTAEKNKNTQVWVGLIFTVRVKDTQMLRGAAFLSWNTSDITDALFVKTLWERSLGTGDPGAVREEVVILVGKKDHLKLELTHAFNNPVHTGFAKLFFKDFPSGNAKRVDTFSVTLNWENVKPNTLSHPSLGFKNEYNVYTIKWDFILHLRKGFLLSHTSS